MLGHESLVSFFQNNFNMIQHHKYSLEEIENMIPLEREIYIALLVKWIEEENERLRTLNKT